MSDPYAPASGGTLSSPVSDEHFHDQLVTLVREYRIWHTALGGLGMLACLLMLLVAVLAGAAGLAGGPEAMFGLMLGGFYAVAAVIYGIPAVLMLRSGIAAMRVFTPDDREPLLESLRMQLWLWRIIGVLTIGLVTMYILMFAAIFVLGFAAAI